MTPFPQTTPDTSSLYQSYSRLRRHPDRGWLYSLTRDHQYSRAVYAAHHSHLLGTNLWVQMTIPLQKREEGRLAILRRASTKHGLRPLRSLPPHRPQCESCFPRSPALPRHLRRFVWLSSLTTIGRRRGEIRLGRETPDWHPCLSGQGGPPQRPLELRLAAFLPL